MIPVPENAERLNDMRNDNKLTSEARDGSPDHHTKWQVERRFADIIQEHIPKMVFQNKD